ncbi:MAG: neutral/alkaline non-lysosomal ceramidase N-terminal domain-containing protein [Verrucomicrobia bacterium]|nr:neutral/alkaline non-lysosomal ceramidase N-terminal domain-containing protein [Verrucomicrobiota bacterium]
MKRIALLFCLLTTAAASAAPVTPRLRAGAATSNITPPLGTLRVGGFAPFPTEHVHDELHARCLVLDDGQTKLALVVCDLLGLHRSVSIEARRLIREATGIPPENVMISATHTHSAGNALGNTRYGNEQKLDDYQLFLARRIADGVRRAMNLLRPAEVAFGAMDVPDHLLNRRWFVREGKEVRNPFGKLERVAKTGAPGKDFTEAAGPVDPAVSFVALREPSGRPISVYAAYSLHYAGDSGPAHISADYFGMFCEALKRRQSAPEDDPPFVALMANATSGDVGLNQAKYPKKGNYERSRIVANDLAEKVHGALARVTWKDHAELGARFREPGIAWRPIEPELLEWAKEVEARAPRLASGNIPIAAKWATTPDWVTRLSYAGRVQLLARHTEPARVPLQVLRIGEICIASTPCETYAEIGLEFKARSPFAPSFMVELNHAMIGYLPTPRQFEFGEYSTWPGTNVLERDASVKMLDALVEMASELKRDARHAGAPTK